MDCFAFKNGCSVLTIPKCQGKCKFYKSHQQLKAERTKTIKRLEKLSRYDLIDKYEVLE